MTVKESKYGSMCWRGWLVVIVCVACDNLNTPHVPRYNVAEHVLEDGTRCVVMDTGDTGIAVSCDFGAKPVKNVSVQTTGGGHDLKELKLCPMFDHFYTSCISWETSVGILCEPGPNLELCTGYTRAYYERMKKRGE